MNKIMSTAENLSRKSKYMFVLHSRSNSILYVTLSAIMSYYFAFLPNNVDFYEQETVHLFD